MTARNRIAMDERVAKELQCHEHPDGALRVEDCGSDELWAINCVPCEIKRLQRELNTWGVNPGGIYHAMVKESLDELTKLMDEETDCPTGGDA